MRPVMQWVVAILAGSLLAVGTADGQTVIRSQFVDGRALNSPALMPAISSFTQLKKLTEDPAVFTDAEKRKAALRIAQPLFPTIEKGYRGLKALEQSEPSYREAPLVTAAIRVALGDAAYATQLKEQTASKDATEAEFAKAALARAAYVAAGKDAAAQRKAVDAIETLIKQAPESLLAEFAAEASHDAPATTPELAAQLEKALGVSKTAQAREVLVRWQGVRKLAAAMGKPFVIKGKALTGKEFSSTQYKGKVIIVFFWATWCLPSVREVQRIARIHNDHNGKVEVIGISCDEEPARLRFDKTNPSGSWVQLFDPTAPGWHALAREYGITAIPRAFLIDKKGALRSSDAGEDMEEQIRNLLDE